jgi:hypothetical protein
MRYLKDLLVTEQFLIKGHANTGGRRLSTFLNNTSKPFLEMDEVTCFNHEGSECARASWMLVRIDDIILAHEIGEAGDEGLKGLAERELDQIAVTACFNANTPIRLSGKVRKRAVNSDSRSHHDFIVVVEPELRGLAFRAMPEFEAFENMFYAIMNRNRIAFISQ